MLDISATVETDYQDLIMPSCNLSKSMSIISTSIDRKNIRLSVVHVKTKTITCLQWIIDGLMELDMESMLLK